MQYLQILEGDAAAVNSLAWYYKYVAAPLAIGLTMCKLFNCIITKRRRTALKGKVMRY